MPIVSVVVPNYNHAIFLETRLETVFNQTFQDFELIFLDDASTDDFLGVFQRYASDPRVRYRFNSENSGSPFKQWNKGLKLARGEYIWIAESDDYSDAKFLEVLVSALEENPRAGLAYCQSMVVSANSQEKPASLLEEPYTIFPDAERWNHDFENSGAGELANYLVFKNTIPNASAVLFRRSLLSDGLMASEEMRLAGDWMFWARILVKADLIFVARPLNYFRETHSGSQREITKRQGLELMEGLEVYSFVVGNVSMDEGTAKKALNYQIKVWGGLACLRRFAWKTNKSIYNDILTIHPEVHSKSFSTILIPFFFYYLTAPIRQIHWVTAAYKNLKRGLQGTFGGKRES